MKLVWFSRAWSRWLAGCPFGCQTCMFKSRDITSRGSTTKIQRTGTIRQKKEIQRQKKKILPLWLLLHNGSALYDTTGYYTPRRVCRLLGSLLSTTMLPIVPHVWTSLTRLIQLPITNLSSWIFFFFKSLLFKRQIPVLKSESFSTEWLAISNKP